MKISDYDHEKLYGEQTEAEKMENAQREKKWYCGIKYLDIGVSESGKQTNFTNYGQNFKPKEIKQWSKPQWPNIIHFASFVPGLNFELVNSKLGPKDMELFSYMIGENPVGPCKINSLNLRKNALTQVGIKQLAPSLAVNKSLHTLDLSSVKMLGTGMKFLQEAMQSNTTLKHLNLYRNILDVDGARHLAKLLKTNTSLEFLDVGHNRIRKTGLRAMVEALKENPKSKLSQLGIRANFISDAAFEHLFETLVFVKKPQLTQLFIKHNFQTDM